jgi:hypothetical protein
MELQDLSNESLQRINQKLTRLVELKNANDEINLDDSDLDQAEEQAKEFVERRNAGFNKAEIKEDAEIRTGIREWLKRTNRYRNL